MTKREGRLLRAKEAAKYLGMSVITLRRMEKIGVLSPYRTPGGHRRYSIEMLEEYLENSREFSPASESTLGSDSGNSDQEARQEKQ